MKLDEQLVLTPEEERQAERALDAVLSRAKQLRSRRHRRAAVGPAALAVAAVAAVLALALPGSSAGGRTQQVVTSPSTSTGPAGPPSGKAVADGRYIRPVAVTGLRISPPTSNSTLGLGWDRALALFQSVMAMSGAEKSAILGAATVTLTGIPLPQGVPTLHRQPAWVGITWGGITSCPAVTAPPKGTPHTAAPRYQPIYQALVIYGQDGQGAIIYTGRGSPPCGGALLGPSVAPALETVSVPWTQATPARNGYADFDYQAPACASINIPLAAGGGVYVGGGGGSGNTGTGRITFSVDVAVPFDQSGCGPVTTRRYRYRYGGLPTPPGAPAFHHPTFLHGPTGLVNTFGTIKVLGI